MRNHFPRFEKQVKRLVFWHIRKAQAFRRETYFAPASILQRSKEWTNALIVGIACVGLKWMGPTAWTRRPVGDICIAGTKFWQMLIEECILPHLCRKTEHGDLLLNFAIATEDGQARMC